MSFPREPSSFEEISKQKSILFSDGLKDLGIIRKQLYSAAEYFEFSCTNDDQKRIVVNTLKDYAIKALENTVDHLDSVSYKVNDLLDKQVDEVTRTELRLSCIEQRLKTCQEGLSQQSLVINAPKYHKRYILPVGETMHGAIHTMLKFQGCSLDDEDDWHHFKNAIRATIGDTPSSVVFKGRSPSPSPRFAQQPGNFSFSGTIARKDIEKRTVSPLRFPLLRSRSISSKPNTPKSSQPTTPNRSRSTTPNPSFGRQQYISEPRKSASLRFHVEKENPKDIEQFPSKSKRILNALLSRRELKKDETLYTYLDEY
ncbi:Hypothetical predicted protein [Olea europaea subsp. europaea]|uniref:Protein ABIL2 n=1 Tax=Olea europaea subsp. europaea TaxID=158383 RepID=A0A8S0QSX2_OLEEU|nr:Hypothetical predicted protein [Olea europaea subsp. europaea]